MCNFLICKIRSPPFCGWFQLSRQEQRIARGVMHIIVLMTKFTRVDYIFSSIYLDTKFWWICVHLHQDCFYDLQHLSLISQRENIKKVRIHTYITIQAPFNVSWLPQKNRIKELCRLFKVTERGKNRVVNTERTSRQSERFSHQISDLSCCGQPHLSLSFFQVDG